MAKIPNLAELVRALAEIASQTTDANTAQRLMTLVHQLMTDAGVPSNSPSGSGQAGPQRLKRDTDASG
jgi:hypothetical protein